MENKLYSKSFYTSSELTDYCNNNHIKDIVQIVWGFNSFILFYRETEQIL